MIKKNEILLFATRWMKLDCIMLSKIRERQISYDFIHMWNLRYKTDEHKGREIKNNIKTGRGTKHKRLLNMENKQRVTRGVVEGGWAKW